MELDLGVVRKQTQDESWMTICHPISGEETTMRIKVMNPDSAAYKAVDTRIKNMGFKTAQRKGGKNLSVEDLDETQLQLLIGVTTGWENVIFDGQPIEFSADNVRMVYKEFPFIREQVDRFISDRRNFFTE